MYNVQLMLYQTTVISSGMREVKKSGWWRKSIHYYTKVMLKKKETITIVLQTTILTLMGNMKACITLT
eukprot:UN01580